jgi:hypothetical protein
MPVGRRTLLFPLPQAALSINDPLNFGFRPLRCPRVVARLRPSAVRVRIRSRSTSASPPRTAIIKHPALVPVSAHGSASDRTCALASTICLTMANRSKVLRASRSIRVKRHHVAGSKGLQHFEKLAPVVVRAGHLLPVNLGGAACGAELLKLAVERLAHGADENVAETAVLWVSSGHKLREA